MRKPDLALTLPAFARMPRAIMHAPGLFRSPESAAREDSFELTHTIEPQDFHFAGPILGGNDLWVLLGMELSECLCARPRRLVLGGGRRLRRTTDAVGKAASHANQTTLYLTPLHGKRSAKSSFALIG